MVCSRINEIVEKNVCLLLETPKSLMFIMHVTKTFWFEAFLTTIYLENMMSSRSLVLSLPLAPLSSPSQLFSLRSKTFSCICLVHVLNLSGPNWALKFSIVFFFFVMLQVRNDTSVTILILVSILFL